MTKAVAAKDWTGLLSTWPDGSQHSIPGTYDTSFPAALNPFNDGSIFTLGGTTGLDWNDPQSSIGSCYASVFAGTDDDCIANLPNRFTPTKHWAWMTYFAAGGYTPPSTQEVGLYVAQTIASHSAKGYELNFGFGNTIQPVRWNGAHSNFDTGVFTTVSGTGFSLGNGDTALALLDSTSGSPVISLWKNIAAASILASLSTTPDFKITDTTAGKITTGGPGMGYFVRSGTGADRTKVCMTRWIAGSA